MGNLVVTTLLAVATVTGEYQYVVLIPAFLGTAQGDAVDDATIEHGDSVDGDHLAHIRQTARRHHDVERTLTVVVLCEIHGAPSQTVGGDHLKVGRVLEVCIKVEGYQLVGEGIIEQLAVEDAPLGEQMSQPHIVVTGKKVDIGYARTTQLTAEVRHAVAGTSRDRHRIREIELMHHEGVEHTTGKHAAHAASFQYQSCLVVYCHNHLTYICLQSYTFTP